MIDFLANNNINRPIRKPSYGRHQNQSKERNYNKQIPQPAPQSVFFRTTKFRTDRSENHLIFQQNKNQTNRQSTRNQSHYSEDGDYFNQNQQHYNNFSRINNKKIIDQSDNIYQPDIFEHYMHYKQTRRTRQLFP